MALRFILVQDFLYLLVQPPINGGQALAQILMYGYR